MISTFKPQILGTFSLNSGGRLFGPLKTLQMPNSQRDMTCSERGASRCRHRQGLFCRVRLAALVLGSPIFLAVYATASGMQAFEMLPTDSAEFESFTASTTVTRSRTVSRISILVLASLLTVLWLLACHKSLKVRCSSHPCIQHNTESLTFKWLFETLMRRIVLAR